jgi:hypothetical protein
MPIIKIKPTWVNNEKNEDIDYVCRSVTLGKVWRGVGGWWAQYTWDIENAPPGHMWHTRTFYPDNELDIHGKKTNAKQRAKNAVEIRADTFFCQKTR